MDEAVVCRCIQTLSLASEILEWRERLTKTQSMSCDIHTAFKGTTSLAERLRPPMLC